MCRTTKEVSLEHFGKFSQLGIVLSPKFKQNALCKIMTIIKSLIVGVKVSNRKYENTEMFEVPTFCTTNCAVKSHNHIYFTLV